MTQEEIEKLARECFHRLCPHAPKDLAVDKSTTMKAYLEGYFAGRGPVREIRPSPLGPEELEQLRIMEENDESN